MTQTTHVDKEYLARGELHVESLPRDIAWLDTGTFSDLNDAFTFVRAVENWQGLKIVAPEEVAWRMGFLSNDELRARAEKLLKSGYGAYLLELMD